MQRRRKLHPSLHDEIVLIRCSFRSYGYCSLPYASEAMLYVVAVTSETQPISSQPSGDCGCVTEAYMMSITPAVNIQTRNYHKTLIVVVRYLVL